ncbi:hypothetical protein ES332_D06G145800v1 [Gossypium tomentosum]|uniref:MADS-box domain-containing protein n=1 Tax=Gossypium tomentosum TaxID=34277 RepID=A0A5D2KIU1_GOSTO|nr:hypothetical protein ES332_D06G145800v1 [Gossypium tomentosum]
MESSDRNTKGKQKIEIKIIENANDRLIALSQQRTGIYKKISELSTLCGGEILFIIFSPAGKPYSFGHPSVESVPKRFSNASQHLEETVDAPEIAVAQRSHGIEIRHWWMLELTPIDQLNLKELYEQDERFAEFNNLISITRDKKIAAISSMQAPMDEDFPSSFPPRYSPNLQ